MLSLFVLWRLLRLMRLLLLGAVLLVAVLLLSHGHLNLPSLPSTAHVNATVHAARRDVQQLLSHVFRRH
jgi:hypothetical protein